MNFEFQTVPDIISEINGFENLTKIIHQRYSSCKVLFVTDPFWSASSKLKQVSNQLSKSGFEVFIVDNVVADPPESVILSVVQQYRPLEIELVVGLGGGSSMDVAKMAAVLLEPSRSEPTVDSLRDMYGVGNIRGGRLPLIQIPTTAGTGSEVTSVSIITTGETTKAGIVAPILFADLVLLDATLTLSLPAAMSAATGIDAMVHAIEAYTTVHKKNPISDLLASKALTLLSHNLLAVCEDGQNIEARQNMLLGALLAGQAFANAPVAAVHALAYPIGGIFHVPHGLSNALVLAPVMTFNAQKIAHQYAELAEVVIPSITGTAEAKSDMLIKYLANLSVSTGIEQRLSQVGIQASDIERLSDDAMKQTRLLVNNPREVTFNDAKEIYLSAL